MTHEQVLFLEQETLRAVDLLRERWRAAGSDHFAASIAKLKLLLETVRMAEQERNQVAVDAAAAHLACGIAAAWAEGGVG